MNRNHIHPNYYLNMLAHCMLPTLFSISVRIYSDAIMFLHDICIIISIGVRLVGFAQWFLRHDLLPFPWKETLQMYFWSASKAKSCIWHAYHKQWLDYDNKKVINIIELHICMKQEIKDVRAQWYRICYRNHCMQKVRSIHIESY